MSTSPRRKRFTVHGARCSYFSQKVIAALSWCIPPRERTGKLVPVTLSTAPALAARAGTHQIPVLEIQPEDWIVADSTPIIRLLDAECAAIFPDNFWSMYGPRIRCTGLACDPFTACVVALMEEYFDEWLPRLAVHTRWQKPASAAFAAPLLAADRCGVSEKSMDSWTPSQHEEVASQVAFLTKWGARACHAMGISSAAQQAAGDSELVRIFTAWDDHLKSLNSELGENFFLGSAPSAVDAVLWGSLKAHFLSDPWPRKAIGHLSYVVAWQKSAMLLSADALAGGSQAALIPDKLPAFVRLVLAEMKGHFSSFVLANAEALALGQKSFIVNMDGDDVSFRTRVTVERSRRILSRFLGDSVAHDLRLGAIVAKLLEDHNLGEVYGRDLPGTPSAKL